MKKKDTDQTFKLFTDDELDPVQLTPEPVTCLGMTFSSNEERREYFCAELRRKLPELRQIEGFPIGEDEDIIALSDPPYYTACPNPWLNDFIAQWEQEKTQLEAEGKRIKDFCVWEPYASDISEGRSNPVYLAHSYHTKVPHPAIMRYILHYTQPGDIVFDGFAGTGMTGVASNLCGSPTEVAKLKHPDAKIGVRHCICGDLSPFACNISQGYNLPCDTEMVKRELQRIYDELKDECGWMYEVQDKKDGPKGYIHFVVWSDLFQCPTCGKEYSLWDVAIDKENKCLRDQFPCPYCGTIQDKKTANVAKETYFDTMLSAVKTRIKEVPGIIVCSTGKNRIERNANEFDIKLLKKIENTPIGEYVSSKEIPIGDKTNDPIRGYNIFYVHQFFTRRNLIALACLWNKINNSPLAPHLRYVVTSLIGRSMKLNRFSPRNYFFGGGGWVKGILNGTLYVPSLPVEVSVLEQLAGKIDMFDSLREFLPKTATNAVSVMSACSVPIADNSVDYIFTDPPFGANIMYSELNFVHEAWLKVMTNNKTEAIVNKTQHKGLSEYQHLMRRSLCEYYRILKPGKWLTMEFSNTSASVWNSIQNALQGVGFIIVGVAALDKQLGSFNAVTTTTAVKQDLVITCFKPSDKLRLKLEEKGATQQSAQDFIEELLIHLPVHVEKDNSTTAIVERSAKILYDRLISYYVQHGYTIPMDAKEFQQMLHDSFIERDGMFFTASQAVEYEEKRAHTTEFVPMALFISSEAEGIEWLKRHLSKKPQTYQELQPEWMKDMAAPKKGDIIPELRDILEENFIEESDGTWRNPDAEKAADLEVLRNRRMMKEFTAYVEQATKPKAKRMKDCRLAVLQFGFKECYRQKRFADIVAVGDHIPESLLTEDEVLLQYYDIALTRI